MVPAGRRSGKTSGAKDGAIIGAAQGDPILWVDTINSNIDRYYERYFEPTLIQEGLDYEWNVQKRLLKIESGYIDFRSADKPQSIEGFGYRKIFLNEAGIILKSNYLYTNAILPMLMDFADSQLYAFGTPKGKVTKDGSSHKYWELWQSVLNGDPNYSGGQYSSYSNPTLSKENIQELEKEIEKEGASASQEIGGEFIESAEGTLFPISELNQFALSDINPSDKDARISYVDVASGGLDSTCLVYGVIIAGNVYVTDVIMSKDDSNYTIPATVHFLKEHKPNYCQIETNNAGKMFLNQVESQVEQTAIIPLHNSTSKETRIVNSAYAIKNKFYFRSDYDSGSDYQRYMAELTSFNKDKKLNKHDDAADATSGLADFAVEYYQL